MNLVKNIFFAAALVLLFAQAFTARAQEHEETPSAHKVISYIEGAMKTGSVSKLAELFSEQTYLSLATGYNGYCSKNQAYYILQGYFSVFLPVAFRVTSAGSGRTPYATGVYSYEVKNRRGTAQVFLSLKFNNGSWQISQFTIR